MPLKYFSKGKSLSPPMKNLSPDLKDVATIPSWGLIVKYTWLIGPSISSTLPIGVFHGLASMSTKALATADLVLEIYWGVKIWYFGIDGLADDFAFGGMEKTSHFCSGISRGIPRR